MLSPQSVGIVTAVIPQHSSTWADGADAINLENANGVLMIIMHGNNTDGDYALTVHEGATAAEAAAGTYAVSATFPIWTNQHVATNDTWVRETDAASYTVDADHSTGQIIAFYVPASILTAGRPWVQLGSAAGNAADFSAALYIIDGVRYKQAAQPTWVA